MNQARQYSQKPGAIRERARMNDVETKWRKDRARLLVRVRAGEETKCLRLRTHFAKQLFLNVKLNQFRSYLRLYPFYQPHSERLYR